MHKKITFILLVLFTIQVAGAQSYSIIEGTVTSEATGLPIHYADVRIVGTSMTVLTDTAGYYRFDKAPNGFQTILVSGFGFKEYISEPVQLTKANPVTLNVELEQNVKTISGVSVVARSIRRTEAPPIGVKRLNIEQIEKAPGGNRDIAKVVQNLPGVAAAEINRNDLIVRGGGPNENRFYLDRIEIPVLNHFQTQGSSGGNVSIINSDFLTSATLYTSAFPANRGNALSSVLDLRFKEGNKERFKTKFSIGASDIALSIDTPLGKKSSLIASYRISYLQFLFAALKLPILPTYQDLQFKYTYRPDDRNSIKILALGALDKNRLNTSMEDLKPSLRQLLDYLPENDQWSYVVGAVYTHLMESGSIDAILSHNKMNNKLNKWLDNDYNSMQTLKYNSNETEVKARLQYNNRLGDGYVINAGVGAEMGWYDNRTSQVLFIDNEPLINQFSTDLSVVSYTAFATLNKRFFDDKLRLMVSLRMDGSNYNNQTSNPLKQLSPRLAVSYALTPTLSINGNIGRYYQEPTYTVMGYRDAAGVLVNQNRITYIGSNQYTLGIDFSPKKTQKLTLECFYKGYDHYPMSLIDSTAVGSTSSDVFAVGAVPAASVGKAHACGLEISYKNDDLWGFNLFATYTYFVSKYAKLNGDFQPTSTYISTNWDYRHIFNLLLSRDLGRGWETGIKWRFSGGAPYTPYNIDLSSNIDLWQTTGQPVLDYSLYNTQQLPPYHSLDLRVDKAWYFDKWTIGIYLDIQNLYNYRIYGQDILMPETDLDGNLVEDPDKPGHYKMVSYSNTVGGTIIPTFGVFVEF